MAQWEGKTSRPDQAAADFAKGLALVAGSEKLIPDSEILWWANRAGIDEEVVEWDEVFNAVVRLRPKDPQLWAARVRHYGRRSQWQQAAAAMAKVIELAPSVHHGWYVYAPLCLKVGDMEGYRRTCREMLARFGRTKSPYIADRIAKTCLLMPGAVTDLKLVMKLADQAVTGTEKERCYRWFLLARGMADYRDGRFAGAITWLDKSLSAHSEWQPVSLDATACVFLAMAYQQLGRPDVARQALDKATKMMEQKLPRDPDIDWADWLRFQLVRREAQALVQGTNKGTKKSGR